ncbi:MAG: hypothetical protein ACRDPI_06895 [Nocardioidaceae bacterium]
MPIPQHRRTPAEAAASPPTKERRERFGRIARLADEQCGLVSRRQLRDLGWTASQIDHEIRFGRWTAPTGMVIALQTGPLSVEQRLWLGVLHAGAGAALSHITAAEAAGLRWHRRDDLIHVISHKGDLVPAVPGFFFHQTRRPFRLWVAADERPPRLDLGHAVCLAAERDHSVRRAIGLLAASVQQGLITPEELGAASLQIRKLRHGAHLRLALGDIAGGAQSFAEINVGRLCRDAGLQAPVRQSRRRDSTGRWRFLDHEWRLPDGRVIVLEVDGSFHMETEQWWQDQKRERSVVISGATVLRCSTVELRLEPGPVIADLAAAGVPLADAGAWSESA